MVEEWKIIREYENSSVKHISGDKVLLSNTGRVKLVNDLLPDLELTLDNGGLYITSKRPEMHMKGINWPCKTMYRTIYTLFKGKPKKGYNIHHMLNHLVRTAYHHADGPS